MSNSWQKTYAKLENFVASNPGIDITVNKIDIPADIRPEFYRIFDAVRLAFLEEKHPSLLEEARTLSQKYVAVEADVIKLLGLSDIRMSAGLNRFLHDPTSCLKGELFDPLFSLLKRKIDTPAFERESSKAIHNSFADLYRLAYEKWVALAIVKLLAPDKAFSVTPSEIMNDGDGVALGAEEVVPDPKECDYLFFKNKKRDALAVPDFIVHSAMINRHFALKTEPGTSYYAAKGASEKRDWYSLDAIERSYDGGPLAQPDLVIYAGDSPGEISVTADFHRICRPDMIIECTVQMGWPDKRSLDMIKLGQDTFKARLGTYIVTRASAPEAVYEVLGQKVASVEPSCESASPTGTINPEEDIHLIKLDFDESKLKPIIAELTMQ